MYRIYSYICRGIYPGTKYYTFVLYTGNTLRKEIILKESLFFNRRVNHERVVMGHFTAQSLHSLKPSVTSQPIQNRLSLTSVTSQPIIYLSVCVAPGVLIYVVNLISFIDLKKK